MRCLVTGASGHLGSFLVRRLLDEGATVSVLARPETDLWRIADIVPWLHLIRGDLAHLGSAAEAIEREAPEVVFHLAWSGVTSGERNSADQILRNVPGSLALFECARAAGCRCFVGVGSQAEFGPYDCPLTEALVPRPRTAYGVAKLALGLMLGTLCESAGMRCLWFRLLATYGPKDDPRHIIPTAIQHLLTGRHLSLTGGEQVCDYLYVEDAARALCCAAANKDAAGLFVLGSGQPCTVRAIVEHIRDLVDPGADLGFGEIAYRHDQVMHLEADISRFATATGWRPTTDLQSGLAATVAWYRGQRGANGN